MISVQAVEAETSVDLFVYLAANKPGTSIVWNADSSLSQNKYAPKATLTSIKPSQA